MPTEKDIKEYNDLVDTFNEMSFDKKKRKEVLESDKFDELEKFLIAMEMDYQDTLRAENKTFHKVSACQLSVAAIALIAALLLYLLR